jgi:hypothetical protein
MWVNPRYPRPAADPPPETLLSLPRPDKDEELRLEKREYHGRPYLAMVIYRFGPDGEREHKLVSVRLGEAGRLAEAIRAATAPGRPALPGPAPRSLPGPKVVTFDVPTPEEHKGFDEFR